MTACYWRPWNEFSIIMLALSRAEVSGPGGDATVRLSSVWGTHSAANLLMRNERGVSIIPTPFAMRSRPRQAM